MLSEEWAKFKSGTDIRGTASEGVFGEPVDLTDEKVDLMAKGFFVWLRKKTGKDKLTISLGHDSRISAERLKKCVAKALLNMGANVIETGLSSTPAMFMTTKMLGCDGAVQLTASHHPFNKNGLKFFYSEGGLEGSDIAEILTYASENEFTLNLSGKLGKYDFMKDYARSLVNFVREKTGEEKPLKDFKIIVDAGNGAGGFYCSDVLIPLGASTEGSQFLEPDGTFPNHIPNPENKVAMDSVCNKVKEVKADFGIIFDTDVDRAGAVDENGQEINRNKLIALISAILLKEKKGAVIVTDSITSDGLKEFIESLGGVHFRYKRGYRNVINQGIKLNGEGKYCPLAIETSGHAALKENYFLDDGAYLVTRLLIEMAKLKKEGKKLSSLIESLPCPYEADEVRLSFNTADFKEYGLRVIEDLTKHASLNSGLSLASDNYEGVRINFDKTCGNGWALVRMSLHDPIMPINVESNEAGGNKIIAQKLYEFLKGYEKLNTENLYKFINE